MKKFFYALFLLCLPLLAHAEFVNKTFTQQNIPIEEAINHFSEWFAVGESTFVLFNDETDDLGYRELDYQQYVNGIPVEGCALYVHGRNGYATIINGDIMSNESVRAHLAKTKKAAKVVDTNQSTSPHCFVKVKKNNVEQWFEIVKEQDGLQMIYRDVYTGEIVMTLPLYMSSTACNVTTLYSGEQTVDCEINEDNQYVLRDDTRHIQVQRAKMNLNTGRPGIVYEYTNSTTDWNDNYLTSFTITSINSDTWWKNYGMIGGDKGPDLYIVIKDNKGTILYVSDIKAKVNSSNNNGLYDVQLPVTFHISALIPIEFGNLYNIEVYDSDSGETILGATTDDDLGLSKTFYVTTDGRHYWGDASENMQGYLDITPTNAAFDVLWGLGRVVDFYSETFNHNGFDRNSSKVSAYIGSANGIGFSKTDIGQTYENTNTFLSYDNAFAVGTTNAEDEYMHFGMGCIGNPVVGLNTIAHEFTHMVTNFRPKGMLTYQGESGALSEGFSDIFAMCVDNYVYGNVDWKFDEESQNLGVGALRDIANPQLSLEGGGHPTVYGDSANGWIDPNSTIDKGGVHYNSTILSHWFYILTEGKTDVNTIGNAYSVNGIGIEKAQRIAYRMLMTYLSPNSDFEEARTWAIQSAQDFVDAGLYGFTYDDVIAVANAWYAVGVGEEYVDNTLHSGKYFVIAEGTDNMWFMSSDLTSTSTKRLVADTLAQKDELYWIHNDPKFVWNVTRTDELNYTIESNGEYLSWTSGNSATMSTTPKEFGIYPLEEEGTYAVQLNIPNAEPRILLYNTANGSHYFAFYQTTNQQYILHFVEVVEFDSVTIRAKMPSSWGETISCWVWYDGYSGEWKTPTKNGDWYEYSGIAGFNIIFVNGTTWSGDNNQTEDIMAVSEDVCIQLSANTSGKRNYIQVDCPEPEPEPEPEPTPEPAENDYLILAKRNSGNYYYLTPDKVSGKDRLIAVDAGAAERSKLDSANAPLDYVWTVEETETGYLLKSATNQYIACNAAKTVTLAAEGTELQKRDNSDGTATFYYAASETETRYLSLAQNTYDYFVFYANENQFTHLLLVKRESPATAVEQARNEPVAPQKFLRNGQVIIVRGGVEYNLMGQPL